MSLSDSRNLYLCRNKELNSRLLRCARNDVLSPGFPVIATADYEAGSNPEK